MPLTLILVYLCFDSNQTLVMEVGWIRAHIAK